MIKLFKFKSLAPGVCGIIFYNKSYTLFWFSFCAAIAWKPINNFFLNFVSLLVAQVTGICKFLLGVREGPDYLTQSTLLITSII